MSDSIIKSVIVPQDQIEVWSEQEEWFVIQAPSNLYMVNALGEYHFFLTKDRTKAQQACDDVYGKGKYVIRAMKDQKTKSKLESGLQSVYASNTRRGFAPQLRKIV